MYSTRPGLILGFHGCDQSVVDKVFGGKEEMEWSKHEYDWLGHGIYFWEHSYERALDFAREEKRRKRKERPIDKPAVIGAVINLGYCLDLLDFSNLRILKEGYNILKESSESQGFSLPENTNANNNGDLLIRKLDCLSIETLHETKIKNNAIPFDSVRGVFLKAMNYIKVQALERKTIYRFVLETQIV